MPVIAAGLVDQVHVAEQLVEHERDHAAVHAARWTGVLRREAASACNAPPFTWNSIGGAIGLRGPMIGLYGKIDAGSRPAPARSPDGCASACAPSLGLVVGTGVLVRLEQRGELLGQSVRLGEHGRRGGGGARRADHAAQRGTQDLRRTHGRAG